MTEIIFLKDTENRRGKNEKEGSNYFLRITIDREKPIDIDTCVLVTKIINPLLDEADIIKDSYILDISSKEKGE